MDQVMLGRTGLRVSVAGLGCGGFSQLGLAAGKGEAHAISIIHQAIGLGVNFFDTAAAYGTEAILGKAIKAVRREDVVIATKAPFAVSSGRAAPETIVASLDNSLRQLDTDYVDIYQLHGVAPAAYDHARDVLAPVLLREKEKGKLRHLGISETAPHDPHHEMIGRAAGDGLWEVVMVGFHMMHPNARGAVFPLTQAHGIGTLLMFVVRNIFSQPERLRATMRDLAAMGWCRKPSPIQPTRSSFWSMRAAPARFPTPPIALCGTSRASRSSCSAPATPSTCAPTSPRS